MSLPRSTSLVPLLLMQRTRRPKYRTAKHGEFLTSVNQLRLFDNDNALATSYSRNHQTENNLLKDPQQQLGQQHQHKEQQEPSLIFSQSYQVQEVEYDAGSEESGTDDSYSPIVSVPCSPTPSEPSDPRYQPQPLPSPPPSSSLLLKQRRRKNHMQKRVKDHQSHRDYSSNLGAGHSSRIPDTIKFDGDNAQERMDELQHEEIGDRRVIDHRHRTEDDTLGNVRSEGEYDAEYETERRPRNKRPEGSEVEPPSAIDLQDLLLEERADSPLLYSESEEEEDADLMRPDFDLEKLREDALLRFSNTWQDIFDRYGKDVSELPPDDVIDLATGELIVDNGVLRLWSTKNMKKPFVNPLIEDELLIDQDSWPSSESDISEDEYYSHPYYSINNGELNTSANAQWRLNGYDTGNISNQSSEEFSVHQELETSPSSVPLSPLASSPALEESNYEETNYEEANYEETNYGNEGNYGEEDSYGEVESTWRETIYEISDSDDQKSETSEKGGNGVDEQDYMTSIQRSVGEIRVDESGEDEFDNILGIEHESRSRSRSGNRNMSENQNRNGKRPSNSQANLSRTSASYEAASKVYQTEWRRSMMMPRARALADSLLFKQPITNENVPSSPSKRFFDSIVPSSPPGSSRGSRGYGSSVLPLSFSVKRRRHNEEDYEVSYMQELDEEFV